MVEEKTFQAHEDNFNCLVKLSEKYIVTAGSYDNLIKTWNINKGLCISTFIGHIGNEGPLERDCLIKLNEKQIATGGNSDGSIKIWNIFNAFNVINTEIEKSQQILVGHESRVKCLLKMTNNKIVSVSESIKIWNLNNFKYLNSKEENIQSSLTIFTNDDTPTCLIRLNERNFITGHTNNNNNSRNFTSAASIKLWDLDSGACMKTIANSCSVSFLLKLNKSQIVSGDYFESIKVWKANMEGSEVGEESSSINSISNSFNDWDIVNTILPYDFPNFLTGIMKFNEDKFISIGNKFSTTIKVWDKARGKSHTYSNHEDPVSSVLKINERQMISSDIYGMVKVWNL